MDTNLNRTDYLAIAWLLLTAIPLTFSNWVFALINIAVVATIVVFRQKIFKTFYPLGLIGLLYSQTDTIARTFHTSTFDGLLYSWDRWLFGTSPHEYLSGGTFFNELSHFFYLTYYLLLFGAFLYAYKHEDQRIPFVMLGSFISFLTIFIVFPAGGPLIYPQFQMIQGGVFPAITHFLYTPWVNAGVFAGAFPSSHVGMAVIVMLLLPKYWKITSITVLGIAVATVYGRFHYAIDPLAGILTGIALYLLWNAIDKYLQRPATTSDSQSSAAK